MRLKRFSIAALVTTALVTVTTVLLIVYSVLTYRASAREQRRVFRRLIEIQAEESAVALALPVWNIDRAQIDRVIEAMSKPKSIYAIEVRAAGETHGRIRNAQWKLVPLDGPVKTDGFLVNDADIVFADRALGTVRVIATWEFLLDDLHKTRVQIIEAIVVIDVLLIVCVYFVLWRTVLRPVMSMERYAGAVSEGVQQPALAPIQGAAEIVSLRASIESMVSLLARRYNDLSLSEERFRAIFDSVNDAIFIHDAESGSILEVNATACRMFGYPRDEMMRLDVGQLSSNIDPYTLENAIDAIHRARPGTLQLFEWHTRHRDGHLFWVEINMRMAKIGDEPRVVVVARDISQRREMEDALRRSEQMSMMGSLVAGVAHEVRNPLFGIAATLDAFEAEFGTSPEVGEYMAVLRNDVSRLSRLMNDLLDYGRPQQLEQRTQSIEPVIVEAVRVCAARAREKQIEIRQNFDTPLPLVAIDSDRMLQVLKNLIENAVEFSRPGQSITLRARTDRNGSSTLVFSVADSGPGIAPEDLTHVFEPFFTRRPGGSGLGLAIVQKIVTQHGGTISAMNGERGGAVVEIRLPA